MRILHIVPTLGYGGIANVVREYYRLLHSQGYKVDFISHGEVEDYHKEIESHNNNIFYIKTIKNNGFIRYFYSICEIIKKNQYDAIHIHTEYLSGLTALFIHMSGYKGKVICHAHSIDIANKFIKHIHFRIRFLTSIFSDYCIACSEEAGNFHFVKDKFLIINNPINYEKFISNDFNKKQILKELKLSDEAFVIGHIGSFVSVKNHRFLIDIFENCYKKNNNAVLLLIGDGVLRKDIEKITKEKNLEHVVYFMGKRNDIEKIIHIIDILLFPSLNEGLGIVALEAQASGKKCILSDRIPKRVDLGIGLVEFLSIDNGVDDWVTKIFELEINNRINKTKIQKAFKENKFHSNDIVEQIKQLYL